MRTMNETTDYRSYLRDVLANRCQNNPRYSLRAFARDLEISPSRLSEVLNGKYGLSKSAACEIAKKMGLNDYEQKYFADLVEANHGRAKNVRAEAQARIDAIATDYNQLNLDSFKVISDWYHYAILELIQTEQFQYDEVWMSKALGISQYELSSALARLKRLELVAEEGNTLKIKEAFTTTTNGIPSDAIKKFHKQILEKATQSVSLQTVEERDLSSVILTVDKSDIPEAKEMITNFRRSFDKRFGQSSKKNSVYCLAIQFFNLIEKTI